MFNIRDAMANITDAILQGLDGLLEWISTSLNQTADSYCKLESADSRHTLVGHDGSLVSIIKIQGATQLVGQQEFDKMHQGITNTLAPSLSRAGHGVQVFFEYDQSLVKKEISDIFSPAKATARRLHLDLADLFSEREEHMSKYCASERCFIVIWTRGSVLTGDQLKQSNKDKTEKLAEYKKNIHIKTKELLVEANHGQKLSQAQLDEVDKIKNLPLHKHAQNVFAAIPELREAHNSFVSRVLTDLNGLNLYSILLDIHAAVYEIRKSVDPNVTNYDWRPFLPGDSIPLRSMQDKKGHDISNIMWPSLSRQIIPRDAEILDLRTCRIGDRIYSTMFIDLFPKDIKPFIDLFSRTLSCGIPWRISFLIESDGIRTLGMKPLLASILSFASSENPLINDAVELLNKLNNSSDEAIVRLKVALSTWCDAEDKKLLRARSAELLKAVQGWGQCEVGEIAGDSFAAALSSALAISPDSVATPSVAPLSDVVKMLPFTRPASPWGTGAALFRSPDGKPWAYQPGSTQQTTWIDLIYARPGSGKSVLSNTINLALCLQGGIKRLPRISIIDIGPSSSGLISLIKEALPADKKHLAAYHRLRLTPDYSINPFDTQLGCRYPTPQERSFLVNFITLLATPVGEAKPYDGITDMAGMIVDELYKNSADDQNPNIYNANILKEVDQELVKLKMNIDQQTSWWEVTDALFKAGKKHLASIAQRYASPIMADAVSICRSQIIEDLYGKIIAPTGEPIIAAFSRMISSAVREYPILSKVTAFDLGEARIVSLDLDEVAKSGGEAADRQTAIMYMLARYVLAKNYYLTEDNLEDFPETYREHHRERILELREDPKRLVMDEFHRTSKAHAVREQVLVDMREGRKWKVQVALLSQSLDDFDEVMVEFATSIFIMDAGPKQAVDKSVETFGLSETARFALSTRVHGPRAEGATFLAQFATKMGLNTQLCTATLGPIELWAFNTTAEDARIRNALYKRIGAAETRKLLAMLYPNGSIAKVVEERLAQMRENNDKLTSEEDSINVIDQLIEEILEVYQSQH